jgi:soluble lytic murein transglycosylase
MGLLAGPRAQGGWADHEADALFEKIAGQPNFYGNLADEELGRTILPPPKAKAPTAEEQRAAPRQSGDSPGARLLPAGDAHRSGREWNWSLRGMDDRELLAAADLARRNQIWDRAINTADRTKKRARLHRCASSRRMANRCVRRRRISRSTMPGFMA